MKNSRVHWLLLHVKIWVFSEEWDSPSPHPTCTHVSRVNNPPRGLGSDATTQNILVDASEFLLPDITDPLETSNFSVTLNTPIGKLLLSLALVAPEEKDAWTCCLLRVAPLLKAEQTSLHLISMQRCQRGFCSEWQTSPQITRESSTLNLLQLCLANGRQEAHIHYCWLARVSSISSRAHRLTVTLNIDNQTHIS